MGRIFGKTEVKNPKPKKKKNDKNRHRNTIKNFHVTVKERELIEARIAITGLKQRTFFIQSCLYQKILVKGNIRTFSIINDTLRDLTEKIDRNPDLTILDPTDAERLKTILEIMNYLYGGDDNVRHPKQVQLRAHPPGR